MSDTPETDALGPFTVFDHAGQPYQSDLVPGDFARRLELERDALKSKNAKLYNIAKTATRYLSQSYRNEFADEVRELRDEIEQIENRK